MRRQLFTVASAISLLLCVGSAGLWVRSYSRFYWATRYYAMNRQITFATEPSRLVIGRTFIPAKWFGEKYDEQWDLRSEELPYLFQIPWRWRFLGFDTNRIADNWEGAPVTNEVLIPFWFLTLLFAIFPAARLMHRFRRVLRRHTGSCPTCSYSLTGNTSGVCPECGTPVPKEPAEKSPRPA